MALNQTDTKKLKLKRQKLRDVSPIKKEQSKAMDRKIREFRSYRKDIKK